MRTTLFPGFQVEDNDEQVLMLLDSEGMLSKWREVKVPEGTDRILIYDPLDKNERWIFMEFTGVPGDEGLVVYLIKLEALKSPQVIKFLRSIEKLRDIPSLENYGTAGLHFPPNRKNN